MSSVPHHDTILCSPSFVSMPDGHLLRTALFQIFILVSHTIRELVLCELIVHLVSLGVSLFNACFVTNRFGMFESSTFTVEICTV